MMDLSKYFQPVPVSFFIFIKLIIAFTVSSVIGHSSPITCLAFSSDRLNVVSGASDGSVAYWNTPNSFTALETVPISSPNIVFYAHPSAVVAVAHHVGLGVIIRYD